MKKGKHFETGKNIQKIVFFVFLIMFLGLAGCSKQFARIEDNQAQLKLMAQANAAQLAEIAEYIGHNQDELKEKILQVQNEINVVADKVNVVSNEQAKLHETSQNSIQQVANQLSQVSSNQEVLKTGLVISHNEAAKIAANLTAMSQKQAELYNTVQNNNGKVMEKAAELEKGQNILLAGIEDSKSKTLKVSAEVAALAQEQAKLHETSQNSIRQVANQLSQVSGNQEVLKTGLDVSHNETAKIANNLTAMSQKQAELYNTVQNNNGKLMEKAAELEKGQNVLLAGIEDSKSKTIKVSAELAAINQEQAKLHETSQNSIQQVANQLSQVSGNQEVLKVGLVVSHNETAKVADNIAALGEIQKEYNGAIKEANIKLSEKVAVIEQKQSDLQTGIEKVQNETNGIAANISSVGNEQTNLQENVNAYNKQLDERMNSIEQNKKDLQATIKQMSDSVQQVAGNIGTFEQNLAKLQEIVQGKMGDLITASKTNNQGQTEFQAKIKNDLLALTDSVNVIRKSHDQLQKKIEDVQTKTDSISIEFPAAIEKLRKDMLKEEETTYSSDQ